MGLLDSIKNIMTIPDEDEFEEEAENEAYGRANDEPAVQKREIAPRLIKSRNDKTNGGAMQVVLVKPERFEDSRPIADHLNEGKTVVLNLEDANREESRRIVDFLSGVAYANHGNIRQVAKKTFIIVANNIDVMGELVLEDYDESKLYF